MSRFSQKHYEAVAAAFAVSYPPIAAAVAMSYPAAPEVAEQRVWWRCVQSMATMFQHDNPRFDYDRFINACEPVALREIEIA